MAEPMENTVQQENVPDTGAERTFTQAEVNALIERRIARATRGMPDDAELSAFRAWREGRQNEQDTVSALTRERDESRAALSAAEAELAQFQREKLLLEKGVPAADVDYYAFKIGKLVTDELPFEKAAEQFLQEKNPGRVRVDLTAPLGEGKASLAPNEVMNNLIRGK